MIVPTGSYSWSEFNDTEVEIGKYTAIARDCRFHAADNHASVHNRKSVANNISHDRYSKGKIRIGNDVWIGEGARILSGANIEDGAIIGAGAVVAGHIPPYSVVVGNPARVTRYRFTPDIRERLLKIKWWDWEEEKIQEAREDFDDIDKFIKLYDKTS